VPFLVITLFFLYSHGKDLTTQTSNHLVSVRNIKKSQLEDYFNNLKEQIINFSQQDFAGNSIGRFYGFTGAFEKLGTTPQEARSRAQARYLPGTWDQLRKPDSQVEIEPSISALILADEMYGRVHQRFHRGYADMVRKSNYSDIFLVDLNGDGYADMVRKSNYSDIFLVDLNGDVVYSVTKHPNFATNLLSGPYQGSGLGQTFAKIKRRLDGGQKPQQIFEFTDFGRNELTGQVVAYMAALTSGCAPMPGWHRSSASRTASAPTSGRCKRHSSPRRSPVSRGSGCSTLIRMTRCWPPTPR